MKIFRECLLLLVLAGVLALFSLWLNPKRPVLAWTKPGAAEVELAQVQHWTQPVLWVDARNLEAFLQQHIPSAIFLNESAWEQSLPVFLAVWRPGMKIVVYCDSQSCDASQAVAQRIERELHLSEVYVLKGGWASWRQIHR
jgi:rhodanese-related sulfurtransferase